MKRCSKCQAEKPKNQFYKDKNRLDGYQYQCKLCQNQLSKKHYENNKTIVLERQLVYYQTNKIQRDNYQKRYMLDNKQKVKESKRKTVSKRRKIDPDFKLLDNLRGRIYTALKNNSKSARTMELIGCSIDQLRKHLESTFYKRDNNEQMTWNNHTLNGWHIDHIRPCASFNLSDLEEQRKCFHYTNLQALWSEDNYAKSDRVISLC